MGAVAQVKLIAEGCDDSPRIVNVRYTTHLRMQYLSQEEVFQLKELEISTCFGTRRQDQTSTDLPPNPTKTTSQSGLDFRFRRGRIVEKRRR